MMLTRSVFASWTLVPLILTGDELSRAAGVWLVQAMVGENIDEAANKLLAVAEVGPLLGSGLIFVFAILGIVGTAVQAVFIMMQIAMLRLVLGWAPIAAAASGIGSAGIQAWTKLRNWAVVFALFPFVRDRFPLRRRCYRRARRLRRNDPADALVPDDARVGETDRSGDGFDGRRQRRNGAGRNARRDRREYGRIDDPVDVLVR
ncbi:hypothetical protein R3Q06_31145 [Rhodococcus erythropolis]|uniref:hypothetical protein n=1 Tax=Rhodococcus erythropolis TaxID=1833 RepID=UPI00294A4843|nr:hypothetical protein [Rhodococcus erythropolis]MDV6277944.1 hypothetical protein [Rhodococcus erythropolis]